MAYTPYVPREWKDEPDEETPVDAEGLNNIENGISGLEAAAVLYEEIGEIDESTGEITLY